jgi:tetratricopeptide (TPR) repeat protein
MSFESHPQKSLSKLVELHRLELENKVIQSADANYLYRKLEIQQRILQLKTTLHNCAGQCRALSDIGKILYQMGEIQKARQVHSELIAFLDHLNGNLIKIDFFSELKEFYDNCGDLEFSIVLKNKLSRLS